MGACHRASATIPHMTNERNADEQAILRVEAAYDSAWRSGDVDALLLCFAPDAVIVSPPGDVANGLAEIETMFRQLFAGDAAGSNHSSEIVRITFVTDDVALVDGVATVQGFRDLGTPDAQPLVHRFSDVLVKQGDAWAINQVRA